MNYSYRKKSDLPNVPILLMNNRFILLISLLLVCFIPSLSAQSFDHSIPVQALDSIPNPDSLSEQALADLASALSARANRLMDTARTRSNPKLLKLAEKDSAAADRLIKAKPPQQRKNIRKIWHDLHKLEILLQPPQPEPVKTKPVEEPPLPAKESADTTPVSKPELTSKTVKPKRKPVEKPNARYKPYDAARDVMLNPPSEPCALAVNAKDEFSGEVRKEVAKSELFRFTNPLLRKYMQGKTHIVCEAAMGTAGPNLTLTLTYTINDPNARKAFGGVAKNGVAILKFIDGTTYTAYSLRNDDGIFDPGGQIAVFKPQYALERSLLKKLKTTELDKIRMAWSTGYDDYDVQQIDLLMRQVKCIE
jgi:hypothetical protein